MEQSNQNTALLVMDMQAAIVGMLPETVSATLLPKVTAAITHARSKSIPVIYVVVGFRQGAPEISLNNKSFSAFKPRFEDAAMATGFATLHSDIISQPDEPIVTKRRVSAFTGSDLEVILRAYGAQHLLLTGIATSGVVLSTLREAADKDYRLTILADCCADGDEEIHRVLTTKVFPRQADVISLEDWKAF
jgi:nicotinamidase-related amidase